jgi:peptidoglycan/xylan/chitin deacetylase (PgdA/CDA1 family)
VRVVTLLYHDIVASDFDESGFPGKGAARYKLRYSEFDQHLAAMQAAQLPTPGTANDIAPHSDERLLLFTVDDGGASALAIADRIERLGWRGQFFITTDRIGTPAFLSAPDIRELGSRGHVIGSHSHTHPYRISELPAAHLQREWRDSISILSDITGEQITTASVPGGFYSPRVAAAVQAAGGRVLFTSEPRTRVESVGGCVVVGRFTIYRGMGPVAAANLARGMPLALGRQQAVWLAKKTAKTVAAPLWDGVRRVLFRQRGADA